MHGLNLSVTYWRDAPVAENGNAGDLGTADGMAATGIGRSRGGQPGDTVQSVTLPGIPPLEADPRSPPAAAEGSRDLHAG